MSGVFEIPAKYVLRRWTAAATSSTSKRLAVEEREERLEDVQRKTRRCNELCRRAVILAEEGSLSSESYELALRFVKEGLRRCASLGVRDEKSLNASVVSDKGKGTPPVPSPAPAMSQSVASTSSDPNNARIPR